VLHRLKLLFETFAGFSSAVTFRLLLAADSEPAAVVLRTRVCSSASVEFTVEGFLRLPALSLLVPRESTARRREL